LTQALWELFQVNRKIWDHPIFAIGASVSKTVTQPQSAIASPILVINSSFCSSHKQKPSSLQGLLFSCLVDWGVNLAVNADLNAKFKIQNQLFAFCILHFAFCISPVLPYFRPNLLAETLQQVY
jgi:hypothetical protein